jgi:hypothetical protein
MKIVDTANFVTYNVERATADDTPAPECLHAKPPSNF